MSEDRISDHRALKALKPKVVVLLGVCKTDLDLFECLCYSQQNLLFKLQRMPLLDDVHCFVRRSTLASMKKVEYYLSAKYVAPAGPRRSARPAAPNARYFGEDSANNIDGDKRKINTHDAKASSTVRKDKSSKRFSPDTEDKLLKSKRKK